MPQNLEASQPQNQTQTPASSSHPYAKIALGAVAIIGGVGATAGLFGANSTTALANGATPQRRIVPARPFSAPPTGRRDFSENNSQLGVASLNQGEFANNFLKGPLSKYSESESAIRQGGGPIAPPRPPKTPAPTTTPSPTPPAQGGVSTTQPAPTTPLPTTTPPSTNPATSSGQVTTTTLPLTTPFPSTNPATSSGQVTTPSPSPEQGVTTSPAPTPAPTPAGTPEQGVVSTTTQVASPAGTPNPNAEGAPTTPTNAEGAPTTPTTSKGTPAPSTLPEQVGAPTTTQQPSTTPIPSNNQPDAGTIAGSTVAVVVSVATGIGVAISKALGREVGATATGTMGEIAVSAMSSVAGGLFGNNNPVVPLEQVVVVPPHQERTNSPTNSPRQPLSTIQTTTRENAPAQPADLSRMV